MFARIAALSFTMTVCITSSGCIGSGCHELDGVAVCGDFVEPLFSIPLAVELDWGTPHRNWPPVLMPSGGLVMTQGNQILAIDTAGAVQTLATRGGTLSPVSLADDGSLLVVESEPTNISSRLVALSLDEVTGEAVETRTSEPLTAPFGYAAPASGGGRIHVGTTGSGNMRGFDLDPSTFGLITERATSSQAGVGLDDRVVYLEGSSRCSDPHTAVVAEDSAGSRLWSYAVDAGVLSFSLGADGEVYAVTGEHTLLRIDSDGSLAWTFVPDCPECTISAAPTVTDDRIYFPVWEADLVPDSCDPGGSRPVSEVADPWNGSWHPEPLYALTHAGELLWEYDGFHTANSRRSVGAIPINGEETENFPVGRPAVAADGTLYVATQGAVVKLDADGQTLGMALYQLDGDQPTGPFGFDPVQAQRDQALFDVGVPEPMLGNDGILYVWDGITLVAFDTGKEIAEIPWRAPFAGIRNNGRLQRW